jgi:hypothetical protein
MRLVIAALPFTILGFSSFVLISRMLELVNQDLPQSKWIEYGHFGPGSIGRIRARYRELHPHGRLAHWEIGVEVAGAVWFVIAAVIVFGFQE